MGSIDVYPATVLASLPDVPWTDFTPVWKQGSTVITTTVNYCRWTRLGRTIIYSWALTAASAGTSSMALSLTIPVLRSAAHWRGVGPFEFYDLSLTQWWKGNATLHSAAADEMFFASAYDNSVSNFGQAGSAFSLAIAIGDTLAGTATYEAA